jgi:hypothetical protein
VGNKDLHTVKDTIRKCLSKVMVRPGYANVPVSPVQMWFERIKTQDGKDDAVVSISSYNLLSAIGVIFGIDFKVASIKPTLTTFAFVETLNESTNPRPLLR